MKPASVFKILSLVAAWAWATTLPAATLTWDATPATGGPQDANGNWGATPDNLNWWDGFTNVPWNNANNDIAALGFNSGAAVTVTLTNAITAGGIIYSNAGAGACTLSGSPVLTLNGSPATILESRGATATGNEIINTPVVAPGGLSILSSGPFTNAFVQFRASSNYIVGSLSVGTPGNATYGAPTAIYVDFNTQANSLTNIVNGATNVTVYSNATFRLSNQNSTQWNPVFPKQLTLSGDGRNGIAGAWVATGNAGGMFNGNVVLAGDSTIDFNSGTAGQTFTLNGPISGAGRLQLVCGSASKHNVVLTAASSYAGNTVVGGGATLRLAGGADRLPVGTVVTLGASGTPVAEWNKGGKLVLGNATAAVNQALAGLTGAGPTNSVAGGNTGADSLLTLNAASDFNFSGRLGGAGAGENRLAVAKDGAGIWTLGGTNTYTGATTIQGGTLALAAGGSISNSTVISVGGGAVFDVLAKAGAFSLGAIQSLLGSGTVAGSVTTVSGSTVNAATAGTAGTLTINSGSLSINGGTLRFDLSNNPPGSGNDRLVVSGDLNLNSPATIDINRLDGLLGTGTYTLIQYSGTLGGSFANLSLTGAGLGASLVNNTGNQSIDLSVVTAPNLVWAGDEAGDFWDVGLAVTWLNGASPSVFNNSDNVTFNDTGAAHPVVNLWGDLSPGAVTVAGAVSYTFQDAGRITGGASLTKIGPGTLTILTDNDYAGGTTISGGALQLGDGVTFNGSVAGNITDNAQFIFANPGPQTFAGVITGSGSLTKNAAGTLTLSAANSHAGGSILNAGTMSFGNNSLGSVGPVRFGGNATLQWNGHSQDLSARLAIDNGVTATMDTMANNVTLGSAFGGGGSGALAKLGSGTLTLSGANSFTGPTTVSEGPVNIGSSSALGAASAGTTVAVGAKLAVNASSLNIPEPLTLSGAGPSGLSAALAVNGGFLGSILSGDITADGDATIGAAINSSMTLNGALNAGANTLTFNPDSSTTQAGVVTPGGAVTAASLLLNGPGGVVLSAANNLGSVTVLRPVPSTTGFAPPASAGLVATHNLAFGASCLVTLTNGEYTGNTGTRLALRNNVSIPAGVAMEAFCPGSGAAGNGQYRVTFQGADTAVQTNTWNGPITIHGAEDVTGVVGIFTIRTDNGYVIVNGDVTVADGAATFFLRGVTSRGALINGRLNLGTNTFGINDDSGAGLPSWTVASTGNTWGPTSLNGKLRLGAHNALPVTTTVTINPGRELDLNGYNQQVASLANTGNVLNRSLSAASTLTYQGASTSFGGFINATPGAQSLGLDVAGGTLSLTAVNTFSGTTTIRDGATLALAGGGSLAASAVIDVQAGGTFDVSGRTGGSFVIASGTMLRGNGTVLGNIDVAGTLAPGGSIGVLTINGLLTLGAGSVTVMEVNKSTGTNDLMRSVTYPMTYGGTLVVSNVGGAFSGGEVFKLFDGPWFDGSFAAIQPATPGVGLHWDATQLWLDGTLAVVADARPGFSSIVMSGSELIFMGTNGPPGGGFSIYSSTNVALPAANWTWIGSDNFDGGGGFAFSLPIDAGEPKRFYLLSVP